MKIRTVALAALILLIATSLFAGDTSSLRPPKGSKLAIIVFEDLQCPDCARAEMILKDAQKTYNIPLVRRDFPLPMHNWSFDAHVIARYFDTKSAELGEAYRHWIFENQRSVTKQNLRGMSERFAEEHKVTLPLFVDPKGELAAKVKADFALGQQVGIEHTPTIYIVSDTQRGQPFIEVADRTQMFSLIDQMKKQVEAEQPTKASGAKKAAPKK